MPRPSEDGCQVTRQILDRIGDKWSLYIIATLNDGSRRFNELKREIEGISQRMLTLSLRGLERDGLVTRTVFPTIPPRVDYALTPLGATLLGPSWRSSGGRRKQGADRASASVSTRRPMRRRSRARASSTAAARRGAGAASPSVACAQRPSA